MAMGKHLMLWVMGLTFLALAVSHVAGAGLGAPSPEGAVRGPHPQTVKNTFLNVADFQGKPSVTGGIQEAIDSLPKEGGTVYIPAGTYILRRHIRMKDNMVLMGAGASTILKKDPVFRVRITEDAKKDQNYLMVEDTSKLAPGIVVGAGDETNKATIWGGLFFVTKIEGNKIQINCMLGGGGLRYDLQVSRNAAIMNLFPNVFPGKNCIIKDLAIDGSADEQNLEEIVKICTYGYVLNGVYPMGGHTTVQNCWIHDLGYDGIQVNSPDPCTITNCKIFNNRGNGVHMGSGQRCRISGCEIYGNESSGIYFCSGNWGVIIDRNVIHHNRDGIGGIDLGMTEYDHSADRYSIISNNLIHLNQYAGITSTHAQHFTITGNIIKDNGQVWIRKGHHWPGMPVGIMLLNAKKTVVANNRILDNQDEFPRFLVEDAQAGAKEIVFTISTKGHQSNPFKSGQTVRIADADHSEVHRIASIERVGDGNYRVKLEAALANSYSAKAKAIIVGVKTQMWGIVMGWTAEDCVGNVITGNQCDDNGVGGILWAGGNSVLQANVGKIVKLLPGQLREEVLYPAQGPNLIPNPDFESDGGWEFSDWGEKKGGCSWAYDKNAHSGKRSVKIVRNYGKLSGSNRSQAAQLTTKGWIKLKPWMRYRLTAWLRAELKSGKLGPYVFLYSRQGKPVGPMTNANAALKAEPGTWMRVVADVVTGPKEEEVKVWCRFADSVGTAWFDDLSLREVEQVPAKPEKAANARSRMTVIWAGVVPKIDGKHNDPTWAKAASVEGFVKKSGKPSAYRTRVRGAYDTQNLYLAFECGGREPAALWKTATRESEVWPSGDDLVGVLIQPSPPSPGHYQFALTAGGVQFDQQVISAQSDSKNYNPPWQGATSVTKDGWIAELAIPLSAVCPMPVKPGMIWSANFGRRLSKPGEELSTWSRVPSGNWHSVENYGQIRFGERKS